MSAGLIIKIKRLINEVDLITASVANVSKLDFLRKSVELHTEAGKLVQEAMVASSTADK